jgi:hypothetical protein
MKTIKHTQGQPIMQWLYAGPFVRDISHLFYNNYFVPIEPYLPFINSAIEKVEAMQSNPVEGDELEFLGKKKEWARLRINEADKKVTWSSSGANGRFMVTYAYSRVIAAQEGVFSFSLELSGSAIIFINGKIVFEQIQLGRVSGTYDFKAKLLAGENHFFVMLTNVHIHSLTSFSLISKNDFELYIPLLAEDRRDNIEEDFKTFFLEKGLFGPHDTIELKRSGPRKDSGNYIASIFSIPPSWESDENLLLEKKICTGPAVEDIPLCKSEEIETKPYNHGTYSIHVDYEYIAPDNKKKKIRGPGFVFRLANYFDLSNTETLKYNERKKKAIQWYAEFPGTSDRRVPIHKELARILADDSTEIDEAKTVEGLEYINKRFDCADFALHGLLRLYYKFRNGDRISETLKQKMKACILDFKYWEDEPGKTMMYTRSENHEFLFFSAEYLAGLLFPTEIFSNSGQNGLFHALKGRLNAERWIKEKGRYGYQEWHSNCYYQEDMLGLLNLYDFGEENSYIRILSKNLLDFTCFILVSHHFQGLLATTHGRSYERMILNPELESMSHINWLLFGKPDKLLAFTSIGALALASSSYEPDLLFSEIARDNEDFHTVSCMGLFPNDGSGGVNCSTFRTADYMLSGMVESKMGKQGNQVHAGQVTMDGKIPVYVTCFDNDSENTSPSYWGGQYRNPKTIAHRNILAYIYHIEGPVGFTHCYFPFNKFDEIEEKGKWIFGRKTNAYIALYSLKQIIKTKTGSNRDKELLCMEKNNIWLIEMGRTKDYGNFNAFQSAILNASLIEEGEDIIFQSPSNGKIELGWNRICKINNTPFTEKPFPLISNKYGYSEYGSGIFSLKHDHVVKNMNFNI